MQFADSTSRKYASIVRILSRLNALIPSRWPTSGISSASEYPSTCACALMLCSKHLPQGLLVSVCTRFSLQLDEKGSPFQTRLKLKQQVRCTFKILLTRSFSASVTRSSLFRRILSANATCWLACMEIFGLQELIITMYTQRILGRP